LSRELGINLKTVTKWRKRATVEGLETGPKEPRSTVLAEAEEAMVIAFRRHTLLPLDDCLYALQPSIPHLTRSALHRCLQRHGISRLPDIDGDKPKRQRFKRYRKRIPAFDPMLYRKRNLVERFFNKLKHFRAVATRYDKTDDNFLASVQLAAIRVCMRGYEAVT